MQLPLEETTVTVASLDDLIDMKKKTGRPIDRLDVEALSAIRAAQGTGHD